jgi:hypothetical protein
MLAAPIYCANMSAAPAFKENQNVSSTAPIRLNEAYSICWSGAETHEHRSPQLELKPMHLPCSQPPLFHYPLPLKWKVAEIACWDMALPGVTQGRELNLKTERN